MAAGNAGRADPPPLTRASLSDVGSAMAPEQPHVDFAGGAVGYRFRRGGERGHPLVRAAGLKKDRIPSKMKSLAVSFLPEVFR